MSTLVRVRRARWKRWAGPACALLALSGAPALEFAHAQPPKREHSHRRAKKAQLTAEDSREGAREDPSAAAKASPSAEGTPGAAQPAAAEAPQAVPAAPPVGSAPPASPGHPDVRVSTQIDKTSLRVGELATLSIEVDAPSTIEPSLPEQAFGGLELIDRRLHTQVVGDRTKTKYELDLLALSAGEANIPALQLRLVGQNGELSSVQAEAKSVRVSSLIANEPNAEPKPASEPVSVMRDDYTLAWVALGLLGVLLVVLATLLISRWLKRRPKPVAPPPPPRPAWELAVERLEQLAAAREQMFADQQGELFVDGVSDALREYLGRRYGFDGLERTTGELMAILEKMRPHALRLATLSALLDECDLVKFARMPPDADHGKALWEGALGLVQATTPTGQSLPPAPLDAEPAR